MIGAHHAVEIVIVLLGLEIGEHLGVGEGGGGLGRLDGPRGDAGFGGEFQHLADVTCDEVLDVVGPDNGAVVVESFLRRQIV